MLYVNQQSDEVKEFYEDVIERNEEICHSGQWNNKLMWLHNKEDAIDRMCNNQNMTNIQKRKMYYCEEIMFTKDSVWKYEKGYRIVTRNHLDITNDKLEVYKHQAGSMHNTKEFNLKLTKIYIEMNCTEENRKLIINVVRKVGNKRLKETTGYNKKDELQIYHDLYDMGRVLQYGKYI